MRTPSPTGGRRWPAALAVALALAAPVRAAETISANELAEIGQSLMSSKRGARLEARRRVIELGDESLVPPLVDAIFFTPRNYRGDLYKALESLTGQKLDGYYDWVEYLGSREDIEPHPAYFDWKVALLSNIDPDYRKIFYPGAPLRIRLEEVVSGGVPLAGIPALDNPATLAAGEARYLRPGERVFGVVAGGAARAYPLRILSWHELLNDVVGGEPVTLSYCTLCGSGIAYRPRTPAGGAWTFDTSGLLYRSNKLMVDRQTWSLWSNLTGEPVIGRAAPTGARLEVLPTTLTTWEEWRRAHPDTTVLDLAPLKREYSGRYGFDYLPGAADKARTGVAFPVWQKSDRLERNAEVYALRVGGTAKAYPLELLARRPVVNDEVGGERLVLVTDPESGAVRVYRRGELSFRAAAEGGGLVDARGAVWRLAEEALIGPDGTRLERVPGHVAFWFGWFGFYPQTELFEG